MSGLRNVLGQVYGDSDDRPRKADLNDVQDSMDALVEGSEATQNAEEADPQTTDASSFNDGSTLEEHDAPDDPVEPDAQSAIDQLSDWVGFSDEDETGDSALDESVDDGDDIFSNEGLTFLDEDQDHDDHEAPPEPLLSPAGTKAPLNPSTSIPAKSDWLEQLATSEPDADGSWIAALGDADGTNSSAISGDYLAADQTAENGTVEDGTVDEPSAVLHAKPDEPALSPHAEALTPDSSTSSDELFDDRESDDQWLDDLFGVDGTEPGADVGIDANVEIELPIADTAPPTPQSTPKARSHSRTDPSDRPANIPAPKWDELQNETAEASAAVSAAAAATVSAHVSNDWIRSDDDILPAKRRLRRRQPKLDFTALEQATDPVTMFSPVEDSPPKTRKFLGLTVGRGKSDLPDAGLATQAAGSPAVDTAATRAAPAVGDAVPAPPIIAEVGMPSAPTIPTVDDTSETFALKPRNRKRGLLRKK